jgi:hypothetical protein
LNLAVNEGRSLYKKEGPFEFVLSDYRLIAGSEIKNGVELVTAIHSINPVQRTTMTAWCDEVRGNLPEALRFIPVLRKAIPVRARAALVTGVHAATLKMVRAWEVADSF